MQAQQATQFGETKNQGVIMFILILAVFMAILDTSIVNVAIPKMMAVFGVGTTDIQWVITAYTLVVGSLIPVTGYLTERFGYKRIFIFALITFTIGSLLCGLAWSNTSMIFFRIVQAVGGGALLPVAQAMVFKMYPPEKRGKAMGIFGISIMFAPAIGPTLSGYLTEYLNWRLIFYINIPIGIMDIILAGIFLSEVEHFSDKKFDIWGFITSTVGFSTLLYGLGEVPSKGWQSTEVISYVSIAIISLLAFIVIEWTRKEPMLNIRLLKNYTLVISLIILSITSIVLFIPLFLFPIFLENISGLSPVQTGLLLLPQAIITGLMMPIAGILFDKMGAKILAIVGLAITSTSLYLTHFLDINTPFIVIIGWLVLRGLGISLIMMPINTAAMNSVAMKHVSQATAIINTIRQVAVSFGIAWATLLLSQRQTFHLAALSDQLNIFSPVTQTWLSQLQGRFMTLGQSAAQANQSAIAYISGQIQVQSMIQAMDDVFYVTFWIALCSIVIAFFIKDAKRAKPEPIPAPLQSEEKQEEAVETNGESTKKEASKESLVPAFE